MMDSKKILVKNIETAQFINNQYVSQYLRSQCYNLIILYHL